MKVKMYPGVERFKKHESGIKQVVLHYAKYLPEFGVEIVPESSDNFDIMASHAGMTGKNCDVAHLHGLYWTADYPCTKWEYSSNASIVEALRYAKVVTVPSEWVAETIRRDMKFNPIVIPHGIDWELWTPREHQGYVLWNKNRNADVCDPTPVVNLARMNDDVKFISTQLPVGMGNNPVRNLRISGVVKHDRMKQMIESAMVYLSTTKETFGIGILEAMAAGVPVLGYDHGGNRELVQHGINGYLARPGNINDLNNGLHWCIEHRDQLGKNSRELSKNYPWRKVVEQVANAYLSVGKEDYEVSVVIPCHNGSETIERTIKSVQQQTYRPTEIIIVDDKSSDTDRLQDVIQRSQNSDIPIRYYRQENGNVAETRNFGIEQVRSEFVCCIDKDDEIAPRFIEACMDAMKKDRSLGIAYTGLHFIQKDKQGLSPWPTQCDYDRQTTARAYDNRRGLNQVPTCNIFRKEAWRRAGGYRARYCPLGAGAEDAELWSRMMVYGWGARKVSDAGLFIYHDDGLTSFYRDERKDINLIEPHWLAMQPWAVDHLHPFASRATPINGMPSHPVRQYDEPIVSFVIPVGEGHEKLVWECLESIEGQTYRKWEAIVVWDSPQKPTERFIAAHPYVHMLYNDKPHSGAGYSRNRGAEIARGGFLVFIDADDRIAPEFLRKSISVWEETQSIVYTDYVNSFFTSEEDVKSFGNQIIKYYKETGEAILRGHASDYDCERAIRQPDIKNKDLFHWCLITCLIPKAWHEKIGGFDENMDTFEDVLYHWVMARNGYCYVRLSEELVFYRMYSGTRREKASFYTENGRKVAKEMLEYSEKVLKGVKMAGCKKCPGSQGATVNVMQTMGNVISSEVEAQRANDENYVKAEYTHPNKGNHKVFGAATNIFYGYFGGGTVKLIHKKDIEAQPHFFRPLQIQTVQSVPQSDRPELGAPISLDQQPKIVPSANKPVEIIDENVAPKNEYVVEDGEQREFEVREPDFSADLTLIPGITPEIVQYLAERNITTPKQIIAFGAEGLQEIKGIGKVRSEAIIEAISTLQN